MTNTQRKTIDEINDKAECLAKYLEANVNEIILSNSDEFLFEHGHKEYLVCTEDQATLMADQYIRDSLWAFNAKFLVEYMPSISSDYEWQKNKFIEFLESMQEKMCEDCNSIILALVQKNIGRLIDMAITVDGIAHFLNTYDGKEYEQGNFFIYRKN